MYQGIFKQQIRKAFEKLSVGEYDEVLQIFAPDVHFTFAGDHALGVDTHSKATAREWFVKWRTLFPTMRITPVSISVAGLPWDVVATTRFVVTETLPDGSHYENAGVQVVRLRFGKVIDDYLIEDTLLVQQALDIITAYSQRDRSEQLEPVEAALQ
jgi:ketosteroid isomerase-like protein